MIICKLQQEKEEEEDVEETKKSSWVKELAHNSNYLAEGHNFQETIWLSLKKEIEGPFSVVIESVDINDGLDHLSENSHISHPKRELFIQSVEHIDMTSFEYASAMAKKLTVKGSCSLPFSWLLKSIIDEIYDQRCETPIYRSLMKKDIFKVSNAYFLQYSEDAWTSAARDLILFEYSEFKDHDNIIAALSQKVIDFAQKHSDEWKRDDNNDGSLHSHDHHRALTFADLYLSFQKIKSDFNVLSEVVPIFNRLKLLTNNNSSFNKIMEIRTASNLNFNVLNYSISLLLDSLNWKHYDLTDVSVKVVWVECVTRSQIIFNKYHHQSHPYWEQQDKQFKNLERLALFVQHVVRNYEGISTSGQRLYNFKPIFVKALNTIQIYFKRLYLVKSEDEFNLLLNCLHSISVDAGNGLFFNQDKKCFWCGGVYKDPVCPPCRHIACRKCFVDIIAGRTQNGKIWRCPYTGCLEEYHQDIDLQQATEECEINEQYNRFKSDLGIFLLESLEKFSFSLKCLPHHEILNKLISLRLYNEENTSNPISLSKISSNLQENYLRETPAVKTAVLQMCLQTNWAETMLFLNNYVRDNERKIESDTHFFLFVLKAMEDSLRIKSMKSLTFKEDLVTENCHFYSQLLTHGTGNTANLSVIECLEFTAKIKLSIRFALSIICSFLKNIALSTEKKHFLSQVEDCIIESDDPDCLKQFAMNEMLRLYGRQRLLSWIQKKFHLNLLPEKVLTKEALQIDYFLTMGNEYLKLKASLVEIILNKRDIPTEESAAACNDNNVKRDYWLRSLAAFHIVHCDNYPQEMKPDAQQVLHSLTEQYRIPALLRDCIVNQQGEQAASNKLPGIDGSINSRWLLHFYVTVHQIKDKTVGDSLLSFFVDLFNQPMNLKKKYFPTMPQDPKRNILNQLFIESHDEIKETIFFRCANGLHVFGFNEDEIESMPRFCHFCQSKQSDDSVGKNVDIKSVADSTEREYALHTDDDESESIRNLNRQEILTIRFLMHSAMIISGKKTELLTLIQQSSSSTVITNERELDNYLIERLNANFVALNSSLECKPEQTWRILHTILAKISSSFEDNHPQQQFDLSLLEGRKLWEDAFSETFVNFSELNSSECSIKYNNIVKKDRKLYSEMLITLNEQSKPFEDERRRFPFIKELWNQRMEINIASFRDRYRTEIVGKCPLLSYLLDHVNTFRVSDKLVSIIDLQNTLVAKFTHQLDPFYLETVSIKEFLNKWFTLNSNGELDCHVQTAVQDYIAVFNRLKLNVFSHSDIGRSAREHYEVHKEKFNSDALGLPCGFLFPCEYGCGQSAIALRDYLIDYHNAAISLYHTKHSLQQHSDDTLSPCNIGCDHVVCVKMETIESLLLINSDYDFRSPEDINWTVDLDILERQIEIRYFSGRSLIDKTLAPKFNFPLNNSVESRLSLKIKGSLLTPDKQKEIELSLHTVPDICLLLRHCQSLRRLLELTYSPGDGLDESTTLKNYADMIYYCIPPEIERTGILENFTLEYMEDLVLFLCVLRARRMIRLNQNPWIGIIKINNNNDRISTAAADFNEKSLNDLLRHIECNRLLCVLFAFSQNNEALKLDDPDASLSFCLYEFAKKHYHQDYAKILRDKIDKSILVKQSVDYFNYIVRKK